MNHTDPSELLLSKYKNILFTGASGWLGSELAGVLDVPNLQTSGTNFTFMGSVSKPLVINENEYMQSALLDYKISEEFDLILNFSFLTQDHMKKLTKIEYASINRQISNKILEIAKVSSPKILAISSGAADSSILKSTKSEALRTYGELKREMEEQVQDFAGKNALICRVWNVSGEKIKEPHKYAIGNFVSAALKGESISLSTPGNQLRSFIAADQLFKNLTLQLSRNEFGVTDSGGTQTSIKELAKITQNLLNNKTKKVYVGLDSQGDYDYVAPNSDPFDANQISSQIITTSKSAHFK